jgi:probable addiction module antidote protein
MTKQESPLGIAPFDASDYLDNEELIAEYLTAAAEDPNPDVLLHAIEDVAKALGISKASDSR